MSRLSARLPDSALAIPAWPASSIVEVDSNGRSKTQAAVLLSELTPVYVGPAVAEEFKRIVRDSEITK